MSRFRTRAGIALLLLTALGPASRVGAGEPVAVLVELYTSQGCSSCPPADRLLAELARQQPVKGALVVPLSLHVDYWNRLGWTDPFSAPAFSERQRARARAAGDGRVYTPQAVVDGVDAFVGSDRKRALGAIAAASQRAHPATIDLLPAGGGEAGVMLALRVRSTVTRPADVLLALTEDGLSVDVPRGENAGRRLGHHAVTRRLDVLGALVEGRFAAEVPVRVDPAWNRASLTAVAFVQERKTLRVLGVAARKLEPTALDDGESTP